MWNVVNGTQDWVEISIYFIYFWMIWYWTTRNLWCLNVFDMLDAAPRVFFKIDLLFICNLSRDNTFSCGRDMKLKLKRPFKCTYWNKQRKQIYQRKAFSSQEWMMWMPPSVIWIDTPIQRIARSCASKRQPSKFLAVPWTFLSLKVQWDKFLHFDVAADSKLQHLSQWQN